MIQQEVEALLPDWWGRHDDSNRPGTPLGTISIEDISSNEELLKKVEEAIEEAAADEEKPPRSTVVAGGEWFC